MGKQMTDDIFARSDDGQQFRIWEYTNMVDASSMSNPNAKPIEGLKEYIIDDDNGVLKCNRIDGDTFQIVALDLTVRRVGSE